MRFLHPGYLNLFFVLVALLPLWLYSLYTKRTTRLSLRIDSPLRRISRVSSFGREIGRFFLYNVVGACLILALAHPQKIRETYSPEPRKMDFVFLLDSSPSMWAEDIRPTRLARAAEVIEDFARKKYPQDRVGLVSFSGGSLILSYLTEDPSNVRYYLDYLRSNVEPILGTNIGRALRSGLEVFKKELEIDPHAVNHKRVFILLSDGEDHATELQNAVKEVKNFGVRVHTIGIASREGAPIPMLTADGEEEYLRDQSHNVIIARLDEKTLAWIAEETGGKTYRTYTGQELEKMFAEIALKEREIEGIKKVTELENVYTFFLAIAFGAFLLSLIL